MFIIIIIVIIIIIIIDLWRKQICKLILENESLFLLFPFFSQEKKEISLSIFLHIAKIVNVKDANIPQDTTIYTSKDNYKLYLE